MAAIRLQHTETQAELDRTKKELVVAQSDCTFILLFRLLHVFRSEYVGQ